MSSRVVFTGGVTGGHLLPGLAVAERLTSFIPHEHVTFAGAGHDTDRRRVEAAGFAYRAFACRPRPRRLGEAFSFGVHQLAGYAAARRWLRETGADVVVGLGGYASVPVAVAAGRRGVPLVLLEQNVVPGKATRWLARWASAVCLAFDEARPRVRAPGRVEVTGTPLRGSFGIGSSGGARFAPLEHRARRLVVLGGSQGAAALNELLPAALARLGGRRAGWQILHQTGTGECERTGRRYRAAGIEAHVTPFVEDVAAVLADAQLVVSRAGGTTLAELAAAAVPSILVPYPHAADDHQRAGAAVFHRAGAARLVTQRNDDGGITDVAEEIASLMTDPMLRTAMSHAAAGLARTDATDRVVEVIRSTLAHAAPARAA